MAHGGIIGQQPAQTAQDTKYNNQSTSSIITSDNVQGAIDQLFTSVSNGKNKIASAITGKGVSTSGTDSFDVMAGNIGKISASDFVYEQVYSGRRTVNSRYETYTFPSGGTSLPKRPSYFAFIFRATNDEKQYVPLPEFHFPLTQLFTLENINNRITVYSNSPEVSNTLTYTGYNVTDEPMVSSWYQDRTRVRVNILNRKNYSIYWNDSTKEFSWGSFTLQSSASYPEALYYQVMDIWLVYSKR